MITIVRSGAKFLLASLCAAALALPAMAQSEIPAGTRFMVELRDKLVAERVSPGKKFEARTLEPLQATDGSYIEAGARVKGRVAAADDRHITLRFEKIDTRRGWEPLVATVTGVVGEKNVSEKTGSEGEIKSSGHRGRDAAIGAAIVGGAGAAIGAAAGGGKGAAIGAASGAGTGAIVGAAAGGGHDLVLYEGTRIELQLDRPLYFRPRR